MWSEVVVIDFWGGSVHGASYQHAASKIPWIRGGTVPDLPSLSVRRDLHGCFALFPVPFA